MIARLTGVLLEKTPGLVVIDAGGVGYGAFVSLNTFYRLPEPGEKVALCIVTNVRENAIELFGFTESSERGVFNLLRSVSGIGPRLALSILSGIDSGELRAVVAGEDVARLVTVPGVGRKTAERIIVELKDKVAAAAEKPPPLDSSEEDAVSALLALGYKKTDAARAVRAVRARGDDSLEDLLKKALARLA